MTEKAISWLTAKVDSKLTLLAYQQGESSSSVQNNPYAKDDGKQFGRAPQCKKRPTRGSDGDDNDEPIEEDDGRGDDPAGNGKKKAKMLSMRLACPFFKHNSRVYTRRSCKGPGWDTVHRVK